MLTQSNTYLVKGNLSETLLSATILMITDKAYYVRWNNGLHSNDVWYLKSDFEDSYELIENISDHVLNDPIKKISESIGFNVRECPDCKGSRFVENKGLTSGRSVCTTCWGTGYVFNPKSTD